MLVLKLVLIFVFLLVIDYIVHLNNFRNLKKMFPKNILPPLDNSIELPEVEKKEEIPKILYRTYVNKDKASKFDKAKEKTLKLNPELTEVFFSDEDVECFVKNNFSDRVFQAYCNINPDYGPARADFFRYLIIYLKGGFYLDIKSAALKNLDSLFKIKNRLLASKGRTYSIYPNSFGIYPTLKNSYDWSVFSNIEYGEINNWHFMAPPGNKILKETIRQIVTNIEFGIETGQYKNGEYSVLALTGPILFSRMFNKYGDEENYKLFEPNFNDHVKYNFIDHKKNNNSHYSKLKNKNILIK